VLVPGTRSTTTGRRSASAASKRQQREGLNWQLLASDTTTSSSLVVHAVVAVDSRWVMTVQAAAAVGRTIELVVPWQVHWQAVG